MPPPICPQRYLEVLQDLILVRLELGEEDAAKLLAAQGAVKLEQLLATAPLEEKHHLAGKFAGLYQLQVDALAHTSIPEALALAECHRRLTLPQAIPFSLQTAQQQLNASDTLVYWHLSPFAITTFLLFRDYPPSALADDKRAALQQRQAFQQWWQAWQDARQQPAWHQQMGDRLYQLTQILDFDRLQQAIATQIGEVNRLLLVPHGGLHWLPLDTLLAEGLSDRQASILYLPHVSTSDAIAKPGSFADASLTIAGTDPEPLHTQIETTAIAALFQPNIQSLGADTTKTKLKTAIAQGTDILQFTGRARYLPDHPYRSAIALPAGQSLTLGELATWNLSRVRLICLPTCELASVPPAEATASGVVTTDPTLGNWATALLAAGATCVLHSLWCVDDLSTSLLLVRFYELLKAGHAPHPALSQARHWLRHLTYAQLAIWQGDRAKQLAAIDPECSEALMDAAMVAEIGQTNWGRPPAPTPIPTTGRDLS
ncbi:MAG: CHAT domain-containing protein [Coleofasciculaceae cyanobacterium SM2_3_26]|nr:CHAT domain-containing protein [Coleofasciculaceae cyanobacterium SM2_3_26]